MKLEDIRKTLDAEALTDYGLEQDVASVSASDLLSDVLAFTQPGALLLTGLVNHQVIRTAEVLDVCAVCFVKVKRLGLDTGIVRRMAIASYEAEMNMIIYADRGRITAEVEPDALRIRAEDSGPGIADIEQAMQPGFSTAPDWVRELGFGAGMGLANIRKCADTMEITSTVGEGTRVSFDIALRNRSGTS